MATARKKHGSHEVFHARPEMDIRSSFLKCSKHPEHPNFHPFREFKMEDIPEQHRTEDVYTWICLSGELTVRIRASCVSKARPLYFADSSDEYPFAEHGGKKVQRFGTGFVTYVALVDKEDDGTISDYKKTPSKVMGTATTSNSSKGKRVRIAISSSTHVVFNEEETHGMKVDFFYDCKKQTRSMKTLHGPFSVALSSVIGDMFEFICHTDDLELYKKLNDDLNRVTALEDKLSRDSTLHDIAAIVSHPHGSYKHVTVGQLLPAEPFVTGATVNCFSNLTIHPENYCAFDRNSKLTYEQASKINLPHEMKMVFPDGTKFDLSPYKTDCRVNTSFSFCPLQDMTFTGNQDVNWPINTEFLCLCDSEFLCQTIGNDSDDQFDAVIKIPKGTKFSIDVDRPMEPKRKFMHFELFKSPVLCEKLTVIKTLRFNADTCPGSSGAKVLFLKNVPAVGFSHSEAFDDFNHSSPGFSCKYRPMEV